MKYDDSLLHLVSNDSINQVRFNTMSNKSCTLFDASVLKEDNRGVEAVIYKKLMDDSFRRTTVLAKKFNYFHRQIVYYKCSDTQMNLRIFYFLSERKSLKISNKYFETIIGGIIPPKDCDIHQYALIYNLEKKEIERLAFFDECD